MSPGGRQVGAVELGQDVAGDGGGVAGAAALHPCTDKGLSDLEQGAVSNGPAAHHRRPGGKVFGEPDSGGQRSGDPVVAGGLGVGAFGVGEVLADGDAAAATDLGHQFRGGLVHAGRGEFGAVAASGGGVVEAREFLVADSGYYHHISPTRGAQALEQRLVDASGCEEAFQVVEPHDGVADWVTGVDQFPQCAGVRRDE
ncbi:hypothetical protein [Micromonospora echinospora]|uniref:hypothetical protein n=1 Tax=Micromonospora echinospora TaxID=1877 RepID=UPI0012FE5258|nr:hypothetical protein [Micromonospora echinospora]